AWAAPRRPRSTGACTWSTRPTPRTPTACAAASWRRVPSAIEPGRPSRRPTMRGCGPPGRSAPPAATGRDRSAVKGRRPPLPPVIGPRLFDMTLTTAQQRALTWLALAVAAALLLWVLGPALTPL